MIQWRLVLFKSFSELIQNVEMHKKKGKKMEINRDDCQLEKLENYRTNHFNLIFDLVMSLFWILLEIINGVCRILDADLELHGDGTVVEWLICS